VKYNFARYSFAVALCFCGWLRAFAGTDWVAELSSPDINVRREAVDRIETLDDPRIPAACLPLLHDAGLSIRRQAARAIGSRFYQIPKDQMPEFIAAMRQYRQQFPPNSKPLDPAEPQGDQIVAERGLGLLTRDFSGPEFTVSPDKKWVLYEERRRPMIATTDLAKRQLLAPSLPAGDPYSSTPSHVERGDIVEEGEDSQPDRLLKLMITWVPNEWLFKPRWQPESRALEMQPDIQARFFTPACIWRSRDGAYRVFTVDSFQRLYGNRYPHWGTTMDFVKWDGPKAVFKIYDCDSGGDIFDPKGILVSVDINDWKIATVKE
jgi:hypothetical protein